MTIKIRPPDFAVLMEKLKPYAADPDAREELAVFVQALVTSAELIAYGAFQGYEIVEADSAERLQELVWTKTMHGWEPHGSLVVTAWVYDDPREQELEQRFTYSQVIVRKA